MRAGTQIQHPSIIKIKADKEEISVGVLEENLGDLQIIVPVVVGTGLVPTAEQVAPAARGSKMTGGNGGPERRRHRTRGREKLRMVPQ